MWKRDDVYTDWMAAKGLSGDMIIDIHTVMELDNVYSSGGGCGRLARFKEE